VIGVDAQVSKQEGLATGSVAAAARLDRDENSVDLCQHFGIVGSQYPALPRSTASLLTHLSGRADGKRKVQTQSQDTPGKAAARVLDIGTCIDPVRDPGVGAVF
jgi:hypothetical protein